MKHRHSFDDAPIDRQRSLSMLMTLGTILANGALAQARDNRARMRRHREDHFLDDHFAHEPEREPAACPQINRPTLKR